MKDIKNRTVIWLKGGLWAGVVLSLATAWGVESRHMVSREHPRLLGSRQQLQRLAKERKPAYRRMAQVARDAGGDDYSRIISTALVAAIENDAALGRLAQQQAMKYVTGPIRSGHVPFGTDLALCALAYDLTYEVWSEKDRQLFHEYVNRTVDANVQSEPHVFHNGWYAYKNWGIFTWSRPAPGSPGRA